MNTVVVMIINPIQLLELFAPPRIFFCIHILGNNRTSSVARKGFSHSHGQLDSGKLLIIKSVTLLGFAKITIQRVHHTSKAMVH